MFGIRNIVLNEVISPSIMEGNKDELVIVRTSLGLAGYIQNYVNQEELQFQHYVVHVLDGCLSTNLSGAKFNSVTFIESKKGE